MTLYRSAYVETNEKGIIIGFRVGSQQGETSHDDSGVSEMEFWEAYQELIDRQDYPGLVRYAKQQAERYPDDPYAQYYLGSAYVLNGEYGKAIEFMTEHHRSNPWNSDFQHVILDTLFALGKTEDDFDWVGKPVVLRMSQDIVDTCCELLRCKRNPRTVTELHSQFISKGYLLFTEDDLLLALVKDGRFAVENADSVFSAQIRLDSKKGR